jgi:mannose-6-phosphate isomerase-like protein (cupin superfamily)
MRTVLLGACVLALVSVTRLEAQQPPAQQPPPTQPPPAQQKPPAKKKPAPKPAPKTATFAILVTDPAGAQIPNVLVTVEGAASRTVRTEGGRIALENLPIGEYLFRFEKEGYLTFERALTARSGPPVELKITLKPAPEPPPPPAAEPPKPSSDAKPASIDILDVIDKEFVGRAAGKTTALACGAGGTATLIQLNEPVADHAHADADEFIYVIAGEGAASMAGTAQRLRAGTLLFVPRGVTHRLTQSGRNPLIVLSTRAGEACGGGQAP